MHNHAIASLRLHRLRRDRRARAGSALALLGLLSLGACGGAPAGTPAKPGERGTDGEMTEPATGEEAASRLLSWSLGSRRAPPPRGAAQVLWRGAGRSLEQARKVSLCVGDAEEFDSMLPLPGEDTILVTIDGVLHTVPADGLGARPTPAAFDRNLSIDYLLALQRGARPAVVLSLVTDKQSGRVSLWTLRVADDEVVGSRLQSLADFVSLPRFLERYDTPRCQSPGAECLIVDRHGTDTYVTREQKRGTMPRIPVEELSETGVRDVVWGADGGQWILRGCSP